MGFLASFRSEHLIGQLVAEQDPESPAAQKIVGKLKSAGNKVVPKLIDALALSDKSHTMVLVDILGSIVNDKNLQLISMTKINAKGKINAKRCISSIRNKVK